jgi:hypothetical protein
MRDMVFISHANPEDNEFARWIALKLAAHGYPVWCDLTKLLGGEVFWEDIEDAIRHRTAKFLYVLSRTSNTKPGPRGELALAIGTQRTEKLKDFVIPLHIDSLSPTEFNVEVLRINAISFQTSWATGLAMLLEKLEAEKVPKKAAFNADAVAGWWRQHISGAQVVRPTSEHLITNWYPLSSSTLYFHELTRRDTGSLALPDKLPYPGVKHDQYLVSFAPAEDFAGRLGPLSIASTTERTINGTEPDSRLRMWRYKDERSALTNLLRQLWNNFIAERRFPSYEFANGAVGVYFLKDQISQDTIWFRDTAGERTHRQIIGIRTFNGPDGQPKSIRYWHFALEAKPTSHPFFGFTMRSHVLFSDDGTKIWDSKDRLHRARRSQCKDWWNDKWRDLIGATLYWLAQGDLKLPLRAGSNTHIALSSVPLLLESPVSYDEATAFDPELPFSVDDEENPDERTSEAPALPLSLSDQPLQHTVECSVTDQEARL